MRPKLERMPSNGTAGHDEGEHQARAGVVVGRETRKHKDAGADNGAHAERGEGNRAEHPPQAVLARHPLRKQPEALGGNQLPTQSHGHSGC